jgi:hypothetical protein
MVNDAKDIISYNHWQEADTTTSVPFSHFHNESLNEWTMGILHILRDMPSIHKNQ